MGYEFRTTDGRVCCSGEGPPLLCRECRARAESAQRRAEELQARDGLFAEVLPAVAVALGGSRSLLRT